MAATLIHIKSRMLCLPTPAPPEEQEDPRTELVNGLGTRAVQERGGDAPFEAHG
jgi:chromatin segregation and condensation protein Rec8/ScpA/Scc1 (kleisin family)